MASGPITSWQIDGETMEQWQTLFWRAPKSLQMVIAAMKLKDACSWKKSYDQFRQHIKKQRHYFANKGLSSQSYGFSSSHAWIWELNSKESWVLKNWCFWTMVLEKTLESRLDCKEIQWGHPKGNQSWIIGRTDVEAETPILWPPDAKSWLIWKDPEAGTDRRSEEKGTIEAEMVGWHHWHNGHESEEALGVGDGQLACCSPWGHKVSDTRYGRQPTKQEPHLLVCALWHRSPLTVSSNDLCSNWYNTALWWSVTSNATSNLLFSTCSWGIQMSWH